MTNEDVAAELDLIADLMEIANANVFRVRSFRRAAETVAGLGDDITDLAAQGTLTEIPGIGKGIAQVIEQYLATGTSDDKEALLVDYPAGLLQLLRISGFGPKKVALVFKELGITTVDALEEAAAAGRLQDLPGMGAKTEENLLKSIALYREGQQRALLAEVLPVAEDLIERLKAHPQVGEAMYAGSSRRCRETVGDLDLLAASEEPATVCDWFAGIDILEDVTLSGDTKVSGRLPGGRQVDLRVVAAESFGAALVYFTGSKQHNIQIRERAQRMGLTINEYGVFTVTDDDQKGEMVAGATEEDVYAAIELPWIPPELREDRGEIDAALDGKLPTLIMLEDIRCDLQMHTQASDGKATLEQMAEACRELGYSHIGITDHSEALRVANGLDADRIKAQHEQIVALNEELGTQEPKLTILHGLEADILGDGSVDLPDGAFELLDYVIGAVHQGFSEDVRRMTDRVVKAIASGMVDIIAHPTGRILLQRRPYGLDIHEVIAAAAEHDVALEINASPQRLDLDDVDSRSAVKAGCKLSINTDSHSTGMLTNMRYGVMQARRGWVEAESVINAWDLKHLRTWLAKRR